MFGYYRVLHLKRTLRTKHIAGLIPMTSALQKRKDECVLFIGNKRNLSLVMKDIIH